MDYFVNVSRALLGDEGGEAPDRPGGPPPGSPPTLKFEGPWFATQTTLAASIGIASFLIFCYCRTRWPLQFAPRTKLKGFSPHEAHAHTAFFGWIWPTLRTSEYTVLQIVGLDAAVLLNFFKMSFYLFSALSFFAIAVLMPVNVTNNIGIGDEPDDGWNTTYPSFFALNDTTPIGQPKSGRDWFDLIADANSYLSVHLLFTWIFTLVSLRFIYHNYRRFVKARQLFALELVHSIPARTVMVTQLPNHLRGERALAEHFESMELSVESVSVVREVSGLKKLIDQRTKALLKLEKAWVEYVGNPSTVESYDPSDHAMLGDGDPSALESQPPSRVVIPHRKRPTTRPSWFSKPVDALEYLEKSFLELDEAVRRKRRLGKFRATDVAFVTFEKMSSAQTAAQTVHMPSPFQLVTTLAPEPRDVVWSNMTHSTKVDWMRELLVLGLLTLLFFFWIIPITALASLLSYKEIKKTMPWLGIIIDQNDRVRAIMQNSLPSVAMISLNALLPFALEALTYLQGYRARSWIEYSLMKKYFLFLLVNVVFIFLLASTYWQLVRDLANSPAKIPEKLAQALQQGPSYALRPRLAYELFRGLGIMPLQLLNLGIIVPRLLSRIFTRTPRDFAELNAPPVINYGVVYPQAILIFVITMLYSISQPLILIFGALYFGVAYVVYKYRLLFVFYKPYESHGQAWPITFSRLIWGLVIFHVYMIGNFILTRSFILSSLVAPLIIGTVAWAWYIDQAFRPLSKYVSLSSVCEVQRGVETEEVMRLRAGHPVTWSQSNLNRLRYAQNDDTLYVAPEDDRTDYSQPPMAGWYYGVLNTGKRRYGHPALTGSLPQPWLPLKKGETLVNSHAANSRNRNQGDQAVVLTLRKRHSVVRRGAGQLVSGTHSALKGLLKRSSTVPTSTDAPVADQPVESNPWSEPGPSVHRSMSTPAATRLSHRLSYDFGSGVIMLPEGADWLEGSGEDGSDDDYGSVLDDDDSSGARLSAEPSTDGASEGELLPPTSGQPRPSTISRSRHRTYFHHPERRRQTIPGAFPSSQ
ncbi:hypothetical protein K488DRAFT_55341 [Vararia minispora EC-137]|uniref:Uncharacterized protein n=1 Tax=Vararia minispora EC-137 TaxID=1314806 RepID=A0ACB8QDT5_9AGAM|nr:hypothetical protein K488DRAFT_55341 [Vararia minispora EC-137]